MMCPRCGADDTTCDCALLGAQVVPLWKFGAPQRPASRSVGSLVGTTNLGTASLGTASLGAPGLGATRSGSPGIGGPALVTVAAGATIAGPSPEARDLLEFLRDFSG